MGYSDQSEYPRGIFFQGALGATPVDVPSTGVLGTKVSAILVTSTGVASEVNVKDANGSAGIIRVAANTSFLYDAGFTTVGQLTIEAPSGTPDVTVLYWKG